MIIPNNQFLSIDQVKDKFFTPAKEQPGAVNRDGLTFGEILEQKAEKSKELTFSKHAMNRLSERGIDLTGAQLDRLKDGAMRAQGKGIQESLVLVDDYAFIVNIPKNTVVTAMDATESSEHIFTNIDGAVIG